MMVKTEYSFCCQLRETYVKTKTSTPFYENTKQKLDFKLLRFKLSNYHPLY